ncbi:MAG: 50S ribosomal protein L25 [Clostridium sp.]|jgi:large subunit ribosomal protein L25|nr:50S ribosomal protein L25 [Clostridium sp.]
MEEHDISVKNREKSGTSAVRKIKREGMIPGVLYQDDKSIPITFMRDEIKPILDKKGKDVLLNVDFNGQKIKAKIQEVQREAINDEIIHLDLMPLDQVKH